MVSLGDGWLEAKRHQMLVLKTSGDVVDSLGEALMAKLGSTRCLPST